MSDEQLRELERRWQNTGAVEDEAAYLVGRVRAGEELDWTTYLRLAELSPEVASDYLQGRVSSQGVDTSRIELAAYCRHEPAVLLRAQKEPGVLGTPDEDLVRWVTRIRRLGLRWLYMAGLYGAYAVLPKWDRELHADAKRVGRAQQSILAGLEHLRCPCLRHRSNVNEATSGLTTAGMRAACGTPERRLLLDAIHVLLMPANRPEQHNEEHSLDDVRRGLALAVRAVGEQTVREEIQKGLLREALGW